MDYNNLAHPRYLSYNDRLETFTRWPPQLVQTKWLLAHAGFFYSNENDKVTCFACGVNIYGWKTQDEPWREHHKYSSHCRYLNVVGIINYNESQRECVSSFPISDNSGAQCVENNVTMDEPDV